ncbi:MAG: NUDIX hydrolase [Propionibacteriaceae bacterium]|nr:NUDIX hydrolase [Propionibacteriaceae bacterium]
MGIETEPIWAAGAVPVRGEAKDYEVMLIHRPSYDDWTLPKGKPKTQEFLTSTAVREVAEETGVTIRLGAPLASTRYPVGQSMKFTHWWVGVPVKSRKHKPNSEVDQAVWMSAKKARKILSYADEREVLEEALFLPPTTPLILLRHAKAVRRFEWRKADSLRPLAKKGQAQLPYLSQILQPFGVRTLVSSSALRCVQTLEKYAQDHQLSVTATDALSEETATDREATAYISRLASQVATTQVPAVACGHAPLLAAMMASVGVPVRPLSTASCVVVHLDTQGTTIRSEWHDTLRTKR